MAMYESVRRRLDRQVDLLKELEDIPPAQRAQRLAQLNRRLSDPEMDEDDLDEEERDRLMDGLTEAAEMEPLRMEIAALQELLSQARRVKDMRRIPCWVP